MRDCCCKNFGMGVPVRKRVTQTPASAAPSGGFRKRRARRRIHLAQELEHQERMPQPEALVLGQHHKEVEVGVVITVERRLRRQAKTNQLGCTAQETGKEREREREKERGNEGGRGGRKGVMGMQGGRDTATRAQTLRLTCLHLPGSHRVTRTRDDTHSASRPRT
eukprot:2568324-Pleurochrysis_carterae.AAC.2